MPDLRWRKPDNSRILKESTVHFGSQVKVEGRFYENGKLPTKFDIFRGYGNLGTRYLKKRKRPTEVKLDDVDALKETDTSVSSELWNIRTFGLRIHVPLHVVDDFNNASPPIYASSLGGLKIGPNLQVAGTGGALGSANFTTAIDPTVQLRMLLPWETEDGGSLRDLIDEIADDISTALEEDLAETISGLQQLVDWAMPQEPLPGWTFSILEKILEMEEGGRTFFRFDIQAPTPGISAFAVEARSIEDSYYPSDTQAVASDIMVVEAYEDGGVEFIFL